jgi:hypothetical protein
MMTIMKPAGYVNVINSGASHKVCNPGVAGASQVDGSNFCGELVMKKTAGRHVAWLVVLALACGGWPVAAQGLFPFRLGSTGDDYGKDLAVDSAGNIISAGYFNSTVNFSLSGTASNLTALGISDNYVAKYSPSGTLLWAFRTGGTAAELPHSVVLDGSDNIYLAGYFSNTTDFDPGPGVASRTSAGWRDVYVAKYTSSGTFSWVTTFGSVTNDEAFDLKLDSSRNVYVTGMFEGTINAGGNNLTSAGGQDIFLAKFDNNGNHVWSYAMGGTGNDIGYALRADTLDNVWVTGAFSGANVNFGAAGAATNLSSAGGQDIFLAKYTSGGTNVVANRMGGILNDNPVPGGLIVDLSNEVYITGSFRGIADFDPGTGTSNLISNGNADIFLAKYGTNGALVRAFGFGGTGLDGGHRLLVDGSNNLYVTGWLVGTNNTLVDFDPSVTLHQVTPLGTNAFNIFVASYTESGGYRWADVYGDTLSGTNNQSIGSGLALTSDGKLLVGGRFYGTTDFDPGAGTQTLTSAGGSDIFVAALDANTGLMVIPEPQSVALLALGGLFAAIHAIRRRQEEGPAQS